MSDSVKFDDLGEMPDSLPLLPIRDLVVFPFMVVPLFVNRPISREAVERAQEGGGLLFLCTQKEASDDHPARRDIFDVGTVGKLLRARTLPDGKVKILVQGLRRARIKRLVKESPCLVVKPEELDEKIRSSSATHQIEGVMRAVKDGLRRLEEVGKGLPQDVMTVLLGLDEASTLADLVAANLGLEVQDAQAVLAANSALARLRQVNDILTREIEVVAWQQKIQSQAKEEMSRTQREYYLRAQLKQIRHELGDIDDKHEEIEELRTRLADVGLPADADKEVQKQLRRLEHMNTESAESGVVRTYLDWLAELPWSRSSEDHIQLKQAQSTLDSDHYGLDKVKDRILEFLGVLKLKGDHKGPILCFVGPPGVGKTSLGRSIARALGREFVRLSLGGVHDESEIRGHRRTYVGAMPGRIIAGLKQAGTNNPVFMLDELDKLGRDARGDPAAALLEVLDPEQNGSFRDHYLNLPFDLSQVMWVATANVVDTIPAALRDRMELIQLSGYDRAEKVQIARRYLIPKQRSACGLEDDKLSFASGTVESIVDRYTREAGLRGLEKQLAAVSRKVARQFAEGRKRGVKVRPEDLERFLGARRHDPDRPDEVDRVGLATGLAWTEAGGTILHVEATLLPGRPGLTLTGQLGAVMKESAQTALSCARSRSEEFGFEHDRLKDHEIHVHVPHGAIPKDGPSAGVTMGLAIISLLTGLALRRDVAMTGEITLRGRVLAVGGLREKMLAAARAGIRAVIVPAANAPDLAEIPKALLEQLEVHQIRELDEALPLALVGYEPTPGPRPVSREQVPQVGLA